MTFGRRNPELWWGVILLGTVISLAVVTPLLSSNSPVEIVGANLQPPGTEFWFGTDQLGRDVFVRTWAAARLDVLIALLGVSIPLVVGTLIGAVVGTSESRTLRVVANFVIDSINVFPFFVLVIAIVAIVGPGVRGLIISLALVNWARYAKIARSRALILRDEDYILAARVLGYRRSRTIRRHVLPNTFSETTAYALSDFVLVIVTVSALSFLGAGVRPPTAEWGAMMAEGRIYLRSQWWMTVFPGMALSMTAAGVALIAQALTGKMVWRGS